MPVNKDETLEITLQCPKDIAHYLEECLWGLSGVESIKENFKDEELQTLQIYTHEAGLVNDIKALLQSTETPGTILGTKTLQEEDWAESWKQYWHTTSITENLVIRPSWEAYTPSKLNEQVIVLDPGCAFGTGNHETTQLMLQGIEKLAQEKDFSQRAILDVGTGSGILAIYAAKLGSPSVLGVDNDPLAVSAARENVIGNQVSHQVTISETPLGELCQTKYDIILANIIAPVILELLPEICLRLEPGGTLLASGLIASAMETIKSALTTTGFKHLQQFQQGDWFAIRGEYWP